MKILLIFTLVTIPLSANGDKWRERSVETTIREADTNDEEKKQQLLSIIEAEKQKCPEESPWTPMAVSTKVTPIDATLFAEPANENLVEAADDEVNTPLSVGGLFFPRLIFANLIGGTACSLLTGWGFLTANRIPRELIVCAKRLPKFWTNLAGVPLEAEKTGSGWAIVNEPYEGYGWQTGMYVIQSDEESMRNFATEFAGSCGGNYRSYLPKNKRP